MVKIKILDRGFMTTHYGYLAADSVVEVNPGFADYAIKRMKSAEIVQTEKPKAAKKKAHKK